MSRDVRSSNLWRRLDRPGHEAACLVERGDGSSGLVTRYPGLWETDSIHLETGGG